MVEENEVVGQDAVKCLLCGQDADGYEHVRTAVFSNGAREFGPERVTVTPCGCITEFPLFAGEDDIDDSDEPVHKTEVVIIDEMYDKHVLRFFDVWEEEDWYVLGDGDYE